MAYDIRDGAAATSKRPIHMHQRLGVFVDVQNLFYSAKSSYQKKVDFDALLRKVVAGRALVRAICYIVQTKEVDQKGFINQLLEGGYRSGWAMYRMVSPVGTSIPYNYGTVDFSNQLDPVPMAEAMLQAHPDRDLDALQELLSLRDHVSSETWVLIASTTRPEGGD